MKAAYPTHHTTLALFAAALFLVAPGCLGPDPYATDASDPDAGTDAPAEQEPVRTFGPGPGEGASGSGPGGGGPGGCLMLKRDPPPQLVITAIERGLGSAETENATAEWVEIHNNETFDVVLWLWSIEDGDGERFDFSPCPVLHAGASLRIHTGAGNDTASDVHMGRTEPMWDDDHDEARLLDPDGVVVATRTY